MNPAALEALIARGQDGALPRTTLGKLYLDAGDSTRARAHLERAVALDAQYSAAWKLLGHACAADGDPAAAIAAWTQGIAVATAHGDLQAVKEMEVFRRRLQRAARTPDAGSPPAAPAP